MKFRKRVFEIIEISNDGDKVSAIYDAFMMFTIIASIVPLAFKYTTPTFEMIDRITVVIFIIDYLLRLMTADYKLGKGVKSFALYPFTFMAIIDLLSILPSISALGNVWKILKVFRLFRTFRILRVFKGIRYSKNIQMFVRVFKKEKNALVTIFGMAILYVLIAALVIINVEPESFDTYFDAVYWATVSLTTVGYGDIYPVTIPGQIVTMLSSVIGIAIVAMPAGVLTAGFMEELKGGSKEDTM